MPLGDPDIFYLFPVLLQFASEKETLTVTERSNLANIPRRAKRLEIFKFPNPIYGARGVKVGGPVVSVSRRASLSDNPDSHPYERELGVVIQENLRPIHATPNGKEAVHRWSPYIQGFSASFVRDAIAYLQNGRGALRVLDPFVGSGTVAIQARMMGVESCGVEFNPLLHFVAKTKAEGWRANPKLLRQSAKKVVACRRRASAPDFLASGQHFSEGVLAELESLKRGIELLPSDTAETRRVRDLLRLSLSSILIDCSRLVRSPCLTRRPEKQVEPQKVRAMFNEKVSRIAEDIERLRKTRGQIRPARCDILRKNSITHEHERTYDLAVTSPPYMNGMDYVINYKIEMSWLDFADSQKGLKRIKDGMVACDNVSRGMVRDFSESLSESDGWVEGISANVAEKIARRKFYRRTDMPDIMRKYFSDMRSSLRHMINAIHPGGKVIMVVGDSLMAGVYVPTDLILAKMGKDEGLKIESVEKARNRRSGQKRDYKLRETVVTLTKP